MEKQYYTRLGGKIEGPFSLAELAERASRNKFSAIHEVSVDRTNWKPGGALLSKLDRPKPRPRKRRTADADEVDFVLIDESNDPHDLAMQEKSTGPAVHWSYTIAGKVIDKPVPTRQLRMLIVAGKVGAEDLVWTEGMHEWAKVSTRAEFKGALAESTGGAGRRTELSGTAISAAVCGSLAYALLLVCTVMLVLRMRAAPIVFSDNTGVLSMTLGDLLLGGVTVLLGHLAIRNFKRRPGKPTERGLIVFGLSCGYTSLIVSVILVIGTAISASETPDASPAEAGGLHPVKLDIACTGCRHADSIGRTTKEKSLFGNTQPSCHSSV